LNKHFRQHKRHDKTSNQQANASKKIKTPPTHKINLNFYCNRTNGTFAFAATHKANAKAKAKEPFFANAPVKSL
jgi:hypothetical protein